MFCQSLVIKTLLLFTLYKACGGYNTAKAYGHSKLVVYAGKERYELDGGSCSVGVAFSEPTILTCACINGVWAFHGQNCTPLTTIAGHNHCFLLPNIPMTKITTISNPMRAFGNSLILFKNGMESVQQKVYRNVHLTNHSPVDISTVNSSWTIKNAIGERYCLNSSEYISSMMSGGDQNFEGAFCTFRNIYNYTDNMAEIIIGCNYSDSVQIPPSECQPILKPTSENACNYYLDHDGSSDVDFPYNNDLLMENFRSARSGSNNDNNDTNTTEEVESTTPPTVISEAEKLKQKYPNMPAWLRREVENDPGMSEDNEKIKKINYTIEDMTRILDNEWNNLEGFGEPHVTNENPIIIEEIWQYERSAIKNNLKITPSSKEVSKKSHPKKTMISKLLSLSKSIMSNICPMDNSQHLELSLQVFLSLQSKIFDWNVVHFSPLDFQRIEAALTKCLETSSPLEVGIGADRCEANESIRIPLPLQSQGYDPVIESVWKIFVSVHSYCYKTFDKFYSDHHKYTTIITPLFGNGLRPFWIKENNSDDSAQPYGGLLGNVFQLMAHFEQCTYSARMQSTFPFHLTRPITQEDEDDGSLVDNNLMTTESISRRRKKRDVLEDDEWMKQRSVFGGVGYCLKKYNEPRKRLHYQCAVK